MCSEFDKKIIVKLRLTHSQLEKFNLNLNKFVVFKTDEFTQTEKINYENLIKRKITERKKALLATTYKKNC